VCVCVCVCVCLRVRERERVHVCTRNAVYHSVSVSICIVPPFANEPTKEKSHYFISTGRSLENFQHT